jgi:nucleotide-binding universal stress UspA family protein
MYTTVVLAAALQRWERYSVHALAARDLAALVAKTAAKPLHVLSVYQYEPSPSATTALPGDVAARFREQEIQRTDAMMTQKLDEYVAPLAQEGLAVTRILRVGHAREVIVQVAAELQADLLIIGSHSRRGLFDITLGGTAQHVSRHAPCTVVLVSPRK